MKQKGVNCQNFTVGLCLHFLTCFCDRKVTQLVTFLYTVVSIIGEILQELVTTAVKVKVEFTLEQPTKAQRESRGVALLFL